MASKKTYNALSHGLYARETVLPWEDPKKFEALAQAVHDELMPSGPLEEAAVREVAELHWRKQRLALGYLLRFYKAPPPAELVEAANGGLTSLAAYLRAESGARTSLLMTSSQMLDYVKSKLRTKGDAGDAQPTAAKQSDTGAARSAIEAAYDPAIFDQLLKVEMKIDARISKILGRLVALKEYKLIYCNEAIPALPPATTPPLVAECSTDNSPREPGASSPADEPTKPKARQWGDP